MENQISDDPQRVVSKPEGYYHKLPALWFFGFFSSGIAAGYLFLENIRIDWLVAVVIVFAVISLVLHFINPRYFVMSIFPFVFLLGMCGIYLSLAAFPPKHLINENYKLISAFEGWISEAHYKEDGKHKYVMECTRIEIDSVRQAVQGKVLLYQGKFSDRLQYGDRLRIQGAPERPPLPANPGAFNYRRYLQLNRIYFTKYIADEADCVRLDGKAGSLWQRKIIQPLRMYLLNLLDRHLQMPTRHIVKALILGERQDIDREIIKDFQKSGVVHVLAISGLHVGFILMIFLLFFSFLRLSYKPKIILSLLLLFLFVALVNFKAPVVRASLMAAFYFASKLMERRVSALNVIAAAGIVILAFEPQQLLMPGFQFSFCAVGAILYGYPRLDQLLPGFKSTNKIKSLVNSYLRQPFLVSAAAVIGTLPLTWLYYGSLQLGALLINILIIPLIGGFVMLSFLLITIGSIGFFAADGLAHLLHLYLQFILKIISLFAELPFVQIKLQHPSLPVLLLTIIAVFLSFNLNKRIRLIYFAVILLLIVSFSNHWLGAPEKKLRVTFAGVGQGDGVVIQFPNDDVAVIDAGDRKFTFDAGERYMIPLLEYYGIKHIKYLVGTHWHSDHIGGFLSILRQIEVDTVVFSAYPGKTKLFHQIIDEAQKRGIPVVRRNRGGQLHVGDNCRFYLLHPDSEYCRGDQFSGAEVNNSSIVSKVCYGNTSFISTGDLEKSAEKKLFNYGEFLNAGVLKVGHHGSKTSTSQEFLNLIRPTYAVVSVGARNRFKHPSQKTLRRLKMNRVYPLRTDHFGALVFESDGREIKLVNWRR